MCENVKCVQVHRQQQQCPIYRFYVIITTHTLYPQSAAAHGIAQNWFSQRRVQNIYIYARTHISFRCDGSARVNVYVYNIFIDIQPSVAKQFGDMPFSTRFAQNWSHLRFKQSAWCSESAFILYALKSSLE